VGVNFNFKQKYKKQKRYQNQKLAWIPFCFNTYFGVETGFKYLKKLETPATKILYVVVVELKTGLISLNLSDLTLDQAKQTRPDAPIFNVFILLI
jgi:hypothetical protein